MTFRKVMRTALFAVFCLWSVLVVATYAVQDRFLYPFNREGTFMKPPLGFSAMVVDDGAFVTATDGNNVADAVRVWRAAPEGVPRGRLLVLVGGRGTPRTALSRAAPFVEAGWEVAVVVYPGTVGTPGQPSQDALLGAAKAALAAFDAPPVVYGYSMGGALSVLVAAEVPVGGLFLEAPMAAMWPLARNAAPWVAPFPFLLSDRWDALAAADGVDTRAWVVHGAVDEVVPVVHGRDVAEALGAGFHEVPGGGHLDLPKLGLIEGLGVVAEAGQEGWWDAARSAFPESVAPDP